ncbi:MAG TPA: glycosyltransferase [Spirochaetota bacterium]|nr:glycosyltransferase [Spirochaetota bacterium]HPL18755.1 glycosyltransferase [Spirochaetota bacterium]HQJ71090.1 glycosyltransferase [Spirochaetota bacterium]HRS78309.1 glycosyltransferase [Spirochaetota bacterium]HRT76297.1 glycosyltransferase [Spirochaetota bacterium]
MKQGKGVELIVGIPSYMEADTIGFVTQQADMGIQRYFRNLETVIINVDNNSEDDTRSAFMSTPTATPKEYISTPKGVKGKGNNLMNLFRVAQSHAATLKAVVVLDADLRSVTPEWIKHFAEPILRGYDYALPRYSRHQFDGTITNHICYPLLYGLMGENVRQPIGGDFSFSPRLALYWLDQKWLPTTRLYGIDIFMTLNAIIGKFKICEVGLGAKIHKASAPKLGPMFTQVVTTFFDKVLSKKADWIGMPEDNPKPKPLFGIKKLDPPQELAIDIRDLKDKLRNEFLSREKLLKKYLSPYLYLNIRHMIERDHYDMDTLMWTQSVYQILYTFDTGTPRMKKDIIEALKPLYFARSVTFDYETWKYRIDFAEELILHQAMAFASQKPYFYGLYLKRAQEMDKKLKRKQ